MSEFTRAQIQVLMKRAADAIRQSQEIRRELDGVMKRTVRTQPSTKRPSRLFKKVITDG
jgi:hypothetical protein